MCTQKIEFNYAIDAQRAVLALGEVAHMMLGTAVLVDVNRYTTTQVSNVCHQFGGYMANEVTGYDRNLLAGIMNNGMLS